MDTRILLVEIGDSHELLPDQLELLFLGRQLRRQAADLLVHLGDPLAQLRALAGPCRLSRLEQLLLAGRCRSNRWIAAPAHQLGREVNGVVAVALGEKPSLPGREFVELGSHHAERRPGHRIIEPQHDLAIFDLPAFLDEDLADDAAGRMLHLLHVGLDDDGTRRNHGAGQMGGRRPAADATDEQDGDRQSNEIELADGTAGVRRGRGHV